MWMLAAFFVFLLGVEVEGLSLARLENIFSSPSSPTVSRIHNRHDWKSALKEVQTVNLTLQSNALQTWSSVSCPMDPTTRLRTCPATAAWIGLKVSPACDCVPVLGQFADPLQSVGLNVVKMYSDPVTKIVIQSFQESLRAMKRESVCEEKKQAKKDLAYNLKYGTIGQTVNDGIAANETAFNFLIADSPPVTSAETILVRKNIRDSFASMRDYCDWGAEKPLQENKSPHRDPWDGKCFSSFKKLYRYYKQHNRFLRSIYEGENKFPDPDCAPAARLDSFIPPWLATTPGACFLNTVCQPSVDQLFRHQCQETVIQMNDKIQRCILYSKDDSIEMNGQMLGPLSYMPNPGKILGRDDFKDAAESYCSNQANECSPGASSLDKQLEYFAALILGLESSVPYQFPQAVFRYLSQSETKGDNCVEQAFEDVFSCLD